MHRETLLRAVLRKRLRESAQNIQVIRALLCVLQNDEAKWEKKM
jgi:hypothetical protein